MAVRDILIVEDQALARMYLCSCVEKCAEIKRKTAVPGRGFCVIRAVARILYVAHKNPYLHFRSPHAPALFLIHFARFVLFGNVSY